MSVDHDGEEAMKQNETIGQLRLLSEKRQFAGLLMITGFCAVSQPLTMITTAFEGPTVFTGIELASLIGSIIILLIGILSVLSGYAELVNDWGSKRITDGLLLFTQTAYVPYITAMVQVGNQARFGPSFVYNSTFETSSFDDGFIGFLGIVGVISYVFGLIGSIAFFQFSLFAFQSLKPEDRNAAFYRTRAMVYSINLTIAGFSQYVLGAYRAIQLNESSAYIQVAFYVVRNPWFALIVGFGQMMNGIWGLARAKRLWDTRESHFQIAIGLGWLLQVALQVLGQPSTVPGSAGLAPTTAALSFGLNLMPGYLDWKANNTLEEIKLDHYGLEDVEEYVDESVVESVTGSAKSLDLQEATKTD